MSSLIIDKRFPPGTHLDVIKEKILIPTATREIVELLPLTDEPISLLEVGPGDGSTTHLLTEQLKEKGVVVDFLALWDTKIDIAMNFILGNTSASILTIADPVMLDRYPSSIHTYEQSFDVAHMQMVMQQLTPEAQSLYMVRLFTALRDNGLAHITTFHPAYLEYLLREEPEKLAIVGKDQFDYFLDNGEKQRIYATPPRLLLAYALESCLDLIRYTVPNIYPVIGIKQRYENLYKKGIPMFYNLILSKNSNRFISYSEGYVTNIERRDKFIQITFTDNQVRFVPFTTDLPIELQSKVVIFQSRHPKSANKIITNLWIVTDDDCQGLAFYQSVATVE